MSSLEANGDRSEAREPLLDEEARYVEERGFLDDLPPAARVPSSQRRLHFRSLLNCSVLLLVAIPALGGVFVAVRRLEPASHGHGQPPLCRKSAAIAVLPGTGGNKSGLELLVWGGMGHHSVPLPASDLRVFDLATRQWRAAEDTSSSMSPDPPTPLPRWKEGYVQTSGGMVIVGGDAFPPKGKDIYEGDVWLLEHPSLAWREASARLATGPYPAETPPGRRAHTTVLYREGGVDKLVIFGGRQKNGALLNDAWEGTLGFSEAKVEWRRVGAAGVHRGMKAEVPLPRKGHTAVLLDDAEAPQMLVYGGRDGTQYFDDIWLLDIRSGLWSRIDTPGGGPRPAGRDHHAAAFFGGRMFVYGGRSGATYEQSRPMGDLWAFNLRMRAWEELPQKGQVPLPRFLPSFAQYDVHNPQGSWMVVFGGETLRGCRLNDAWQLDLATLRWDLLSPPQFCTSKCLALG